MFFYEVKVTNNPELNEGLDLHNQRFQLKSDMSDERRDSLEELNSKTEEFNAKLQREIYVFISAYRKNNAILGVISRKQLKVRELCDDFLKAVNIPYLDLQFEEVTLERLMGKFKSGERKGYVDDVDSILEDFKLDELSSDVKSLFGENILQICEKEDLKKQARNLTMGQSLTKELDKIYQHKATSAGCGHPVHYIIRTDDYDVRREASRIILKGLYSNNRVISSRYCFVDIRTDTPRWGRYIDRGFLTTLYESCIDGAVVVRLELDAADDDSESVSNERQYINMIARVMKKFRHRVLTVLCLPREASRLMNELYDEAGGLSFIELDEDFTSGDKAKKILRNIAADGNLKADKNLYARIDMTRNYLTPELHSIYDDWYNDKIKNRIFPQYSDVATISRDRLKEKAQSSAYDRLQKMIGLKEVKEIVDKVINYYKVLQLYKAEGIKAEKPSMHMVFTGNPGTAKTTVARLFAEILRDNNILSKGHLVEIGRSELVAKYVGWTAKTVKGKFNEAKGGVLFIDEAYSLVDDRKGSFGDEAINTIVQEMENHRDDVVVIMAGYKDEMEHFLETNPGLRSRIAFHVPFADYNADELTEIAELMAHDNEMILADDAVSRIHFLAQEACKKDAFGNGRYVRNLLERARMTQAGRIIELPPDKLTRDVITTLEAFDFEEVPISGKERKNIGFAG